MGKERKKSKKQLAKEEEERRLFEAEEAEIAQLRQIEREKKIAAKKKLAEEKKQQAQDGARKLWSILWEGNLSENELKQSRVIFNELDSDNNGFLDKQELDTALRTLDIEASSDEMQMLKKEADVDGNGSPSF